MHDLLFYQGHLDRVSRSFAACIARLGSPFREWTSLSYLLCRALDTIEDSPWADLELRSQQYERFEAFLTRLPNAEEVRRWAAVFPQGIPAGEKQLLTEAEALFEDFHSLPTEARQQMHATVLRMSAGMRHFADRQAAEGELRLRDLGDVNRYCYFVAGIVGELLSKLYLVYRPDFRPPAPFFRNAYHFGLFLQKVNLLKDQRSDEAEGRYLVPNRESLLASLRAHAIGSVAYLTALPPDERGYRTFCGWSLFLGAASLPFLEASFTEKTGLRISRETTKLLFAQVESVCTDDEALRAALGELLNGLPQPSAPTERSAAAEPWFEDLRGETLGYGDLQALGVA